MILIEIGEFKGGNTIDPNIIYIISLVATIGTIKH